MTQCSTKTTANEDRVIWRRELQAELHVSAETIRRWMLDGKLPPLDVDLSVRSRGWKRSTLRAAGINVA